MKAVIYDNYGPPSVLQIRETEKPIPGDSEVVIRVLATTVNRTDLAMLLAKPFIMRFFTGLLKPRKKTMGTDFAGTIEAIGKNVSTLKVEDEVFGLDADGLSSHAQYMILSENKAISLKPANISFEEAAASLEGVHYAYNFINKVPSVSGKNVLVNGATGAIGSAMVQLLKYFGAHVTAVCNTKNINLIKSLGVDEIIDYTSTDFTQANQKFNYVFDAVGKSTFGKCKQILTDDGIYISSELGPYIQNPLLAMITSLTGKKKVMFPIPVDCKRSVLLIKKIIEEGKYKAVIDKIYPMEEIAAAFTYVQTGEKTGNVVITYK